MSAVGEALGGGHRAPGVIGVGAHRGDGIAVLLDSLVSAVSACEAAQHQVGDEKCGRTRGDKRERRRQHLQLHLRDSSCQVSDPIVVGIVGVARRGAAAHLLAQQLVVGVAGGGGPLLR